ncbi:MAG: glucosaminidase domain-containing protein [Bacteroidales bacterium]|nr:glucosaminidase domain-containing protein [Bacteroidales bacterium]
MKRFLLSLLPFLLISAADTPQKAYVEKFAAYAVNEMYRSGVPASITLAQGMLESRNGLSDLAAKGNNHLGIKCHTDWKGATMRVDDETRGECFRVYDSAYQSFQDHSDFLRYRSRYHFLFDYEITDYKAWAYGLKKAGYATDPQYPAKLIKLIEENDLARFDRMKPSDFEPVAQLEEEEILESTPDKAARKVKVKKVRKRARAAKSEAPAVEEIPESPTVMEEPRPVANEEFSFPLARKVYTQNGVPFVYAERGDTYASLAASYNLFPKEILRFNDLEVSEELLPGTMVYLQAKKKQTRRGLDKYIVEEDGESLRDICQHFGVRQSAIVKLNVFSSTHRLREGDTILLRK